MPATDRGRGPRTLSGTATADPSGLRRIRLRLTWSDGKGHCSTYDGTREQLVKPKRCGAANGRWFSAHHQDLAAYVTSTQRHVSGTIRMKLFKGSCRAVGRRSPKSLYQMSLATYGRDDQFDQSAAVGFIQLWGLPLRTQARIQLTGGSGDDPLRLGQPSGENGEAPA